MTYDEDADAAYFYLQYGSRFRELRRDEQQAAETYSHSVNPTGLCRFDAQGGLLSVLIPTAEVVIPQPSRSMANVGALPTKSFRRS